jgi:hypothetical protein
MKAIWYSAAIIVLVQLAFAQEVKRVYYNGVRISSCSTVSRTGVIDGALANPDNYLCIIPLDLHDGEYDNCPTHQCIADKLKDMPALFAVHGGDAVVGSYQQYQLAKLGMAIGAPWCYAVVTEGGHCKYDDYMYHTRFVYTWLDGIKKHRPTSTTAFKKVDLESGWLGGMTLKHVKAGHKLWNDDYEVLDAWIAPYKEFEGDKTKASWLPDETTARMWVKVMTGKEATVDPNRPSVSITSPADLTEYRFSQAGEIQNITVTADATDTDGSIVSVEFQADIPGNGVVSFGTDNSSPYSAVLGLEGFVSSQPDGLEIVNLIAIATDNDGKISSSQQVPVECFMPAVSTALRHPQKFQPILSIGDNQLYDLRFCDLAGRIILRASSADANGKPLNLNHLQSGMYIVEGTLNGQKVSGSIVNFSAAR